jgi:hypothetical protein
MLKGIRSFDPGDRFTERFCNRLVNKALYNMAYSSQIRDQLASAGRHSVKSGKTCLWRTLN